MVICFTKHLLDQKHNLSKIWLAAHWEKKIKRPQIFEIDIVKSIQDIMEAEIILDLRISGHLLVGIVRIHSKKTKYLLHECNSIFFQVKIFHAGRIDLPDENLTADVNDITLKDYLNINLDNVGNDIVDAIFSCNQSRPEDITLKERVTGRLTLLDDDMMDFEFREGDEPFEFPDENLLLAACEELEVPPKDSNAELPKDVTAEQPEDEAAVGKKRRLVYNQITMISLKEAYENLDAGEEERLDELQPDFGNLEEYVLNALDPDHQINEIPESLDLSRLINADVDREFPGNRDPEAPDANNRNSDVLELEPINDKMHMKARTKKRKLCIDYNKRLSEEELRRQVMDTSDIVTTCDLAPYSKRLMSLKESASAEKLLSLPSLKLLSNRLLEVHKRNLKTRPCEDFDSTPEEDEITPTPQTRRKRSKCESSEMPDTNGNVVPDLTDSPALPVGPIMNLNVSSDFPDPFDDVVANNATEGFVENQATDGDFVCQAADDGFENQAYDALLTENLPTSQQISSLTDLQSTPMSKTSQEKWEIVLQGRIIHTLKNLKELFDGGQSKVPFSSIAKKNRRLWVAQKFLCLLMLQKFEVISLKQDESYGEIFINRGLHFEIACSKFYSSDA